MLRKFFRHFLNPPLQKTKRVIGMLVVEATRLRVGAEPTHLEDGIEVERENSAEGGHLLIGEIIHLCIFGRVGAVLDELFADVDWDGQENQNWGVLGGQNEHELGDGIILGFVGVEGGETGEMVVFKGLREEGGLESFLVEGDEFLYFSLLAEGEAGHFLLDGPFVFNGGFGCWYADPLHELRIISNLLLLFKYIQVTRCVVIQLFDKFRYDLFIEGYIWDEGWNWK